MEGGRKRGKGWKGGKRKEREREIDKKGNIKRDN